MSHPVEIRFIAAADAPDLRSARGRVALLVGEQGRPPAGLPGAAVPGCAAWLWPKILETILPKMLMTEAPEKPRVGRIS